MKDGYLAAYDDSTGTAEPLQDEILDLVNMAIIVLNSDGIVAHANRRMCEILMCNQDSIRGRNWFDSFVLSGDREAAKLEFVRLMTGKIEPADHHEQKVLTSDGSERLISWHTTVLRDDSGKAAGSLSSGEDMTYMRVKQESAELQSALVDNLDDAVIARDADLNIRVWNKVAESIYGWTADEMLGKRPDAASVGFHGIDHEDSLALLRREGRIRLDTVETRKDGSPIEVEITATAIHNEAGDITGFVSVSRDMSATKKAIEELKRSESKYRQLVEVAYEGIWEMNANAVTTFVNPRMAEMLGYAPKEMIGKPLSDFMDEKHWETARLGLERRRTGLREEIDSEFLKKDGSRIYVRLGVSPLTDDKGRFAGSLAVTTDMTARRRVEESLRRTRNYLENLFSYASAPIIVWNRESRITRFSHAFERLTGYKAEEVIGKNLEFLFPAYTRESSIAEISRTLSGEHWESVEIPILRKDGTIRLALWNSANIYDDDGTTLVATIAQGQDITERKVVEDNLRNTSNYLDNLINYANAPIIVWDPRFRITRFNHAFERLTGYSADEMFGRSLETLFPSNSRKKSMIKIKRTLSGEYWESVEIPILRKDGATRVVLWNSANIYGEDGMTLVATIAQGQDITERKVAEESLRDTRNYLENLVNYASAPIIVWDPKFRITRFNHAFERLTGHPVQQMLGKNLEILFPPDSREQSLQKIHKTLEGEHWESVEIPVLRKDGAVRVVLWNSANIYGENGRNLIATIAQGLDITERKQTEEKIIALNESLRRQTVELEALNKELEAFNYSVSHDLRAPLRSIEGFGGLLAERAKDTLDEQCLDYLSRIRAASTRMDGLIDDLLKLSRVTRDKMHWENVDLTAIARRILSELQKSDPGRKVDASVVDGATMKGDPRLLTIMMDNLISNAWKFTMKKPVSRIEFGITYINEEKAFFLRDNGAGFDMAYYNKLFAPFQRLHGAKEFPGTGIGLVTAQRIIRRHGGRIWGESTIGEGTTFYFTEGERQAKSDDDRR